MDLLISNLLLESILEFGKWSTRWTDRSTKGQLREKLAIIKKIFHPSITFCFFFSCSLYPHIDWFCQILPQKYYSGYFFGVSNIYPKISSNIIFKGKFKRTKKNLTYLQIQMFCFVIDKNCSNITYITKDWFFIKPVRALGL